MSPRDTGLRVTYAHPDEAAGFAAVDVDPDAGPSSVAVQQAATAAPAAEGGPA